MKCPFCSHPDTQVVETREAEDGGFIRRRRQCGGCDKRFTTYERPEVSFPAIVKKDGRRIEYERAKLLGSFKIALRKRRSEEHTSELQSQSNLVCRLLLEKKKTVINVHACHRSYSHAPS